MGRTELMRRTELMHEGIRYAQTIPMPLRERTAAPKRPRSDVEIRGQSCQRQDLNSRHDAGARQR